MNSIETVSIVIAIVVMAVSIAMFFPRAGKADIA